MHGSSLRLAVLLAGLLVLSAGAKYFETADRLGPRQHSVLATMEHKYQLAQDMQHPAVLVAGGSNALTGVHAATLGEVLGRPAYNLALYGEAQDYRNSLALLEGVARPGDVVVYSGRGFLLEVPFDSRHSTYDWHGIPLQLMQASGRSLFERIDHSVLQMLLPVKARIQVFGPWEQTGNYSPLGDFTHCVAPTGAVAPQPFAAAPDTRERFLRDIAAFSGRMQGRGVRVFLHTPSLLVDAGDLAKWTALRQQTEAALERAGAQWLRIPAHNAFVTDAAAFCDTSLHPTQEHARKNSRMLALQLEPHLR